MTTLNIVYLVMGIFATCVSLPSSIVACIAAFQYFKVKKTATLRGQTLTVHLAAKRLMGMDERNSDGSSD